MANIRAWLEEAERQFGEQIEAIVVGQHYSRGTKYEENDPPLADENVVLSREDGLAKLDQDYDDGYGGADCYPMYAWTASRVLFIDEYDGATSPNWVPRYPMPIAPNFSGEGL